MLSEGHGNAQLVPCLDEASLQVRPLISKGVCWGAHATLTLVGSHYGGVYFDAIRHRYALGKFEHDILTIGSVAAQGAEVLMSKMSATSICHQF